MNWKQKTKVRGNEPIEGETMIDKIRRAKHAGEPITDVAEIIYTPRSAGVLNDHDIRTDKWVIRAMAKSTIDVEKFKERINLINNERKSKGLTTDFEGKAFEVTGE